MERVMEVAPVSFNVSTSHYYNEWLGFLDEDTFQLDLNKKYERINIVDILIRILEESKGNQIIDIDETSKSEIFSLGQDMVIDHEISSPLLPPNKSIEIKVIVKSIEKGIPSICDEIIDL